MIVTEWRCGWRCQRAHDDQHPFIEHVIVRRGRWKWMLAAADFDNMTDDEFAALAERAYREAAFDQLQADLAVLARQLIGALNATGEITATDVPVEDVKAALWHWERTQRDTQEPAT